MFLMDGELMIHRVSELKAAVLPLLQALPPDTDLIVDCRPIADIDGAGVQWLACLDSTLARRGARLRLADLNERLRTRVQMLGLETPLNFMSTPAP